MTNITERIRQAVSPTLQGVLREAGNLADEMGFSAYVVGGMVRDLLLGLQTIDVDIVVEGQGIHFARSLADRLHAKVRCHERFGTATLSLPDQLRVDIATARTEFYERPAALPRVSPGSIRDDMVRRDFTINALAASLMPAEFGRFSMISAGSATFGRGTSGPCMNEASSTTRRGSSGLSGSKKGSTSGSSGPRSNGSSRPCRGPSSRSWRITGLPRNCG